MTLRDSSPRSGSRPAGPPRVTPTQSARRFIETLVDGVPGWTPIDELLSLFTLALTTVDLPGDIVEIGAWCGRSSVVLSHAAAHLPACRVLSVDLFPERDDWRQNQDGSFSMHVSVDGEVHASYVEQTVWPEPFQRDIAPLYRTHRGVREIFDDVIRRRGVPDLIDTVRGTSAVLRSRAAQGMRCRLAFLDGDHGYSAVCEDIHRVESILVPGGWICFDDAFSHYDGVNRAISELVIDSGAYTITQQLTRKLFVAKRR